MHLRDYTAADYDALIAHLIEFQDGDRLREPEYAPGVEIAHSYLHGVFAACLIGTRSGRRPPGRVVVAEEGGAVVGYTGFHETVLECLSDGRAVQVLDLYVAPACRGRGIGGRLLAEAEAFARERGVPRLALVTLARNTEARALYARCGFREFEVSLVKDVTQG